MIDDKLFQQHGSIPPILEPCSDHIFGTLSLTANIIYYCLQIRIISFNVFHIPPPSSLSYPAFVLGNEMLILFWFLFYFLIYQKFPVWSAPPSCCCLDSEETLTWIVSTSWMMKVWRETKDILICLISVLFHVLGWWRCLPLMSSENPITIWRHKNKKGLIWNILWK